MNLPITEENKLNEVGDRLATLLGMKVDHEASPDSQGRTRWRTTIGNKTGVGLLRTIESHIAGELRSMGRAVPPPRA
jgi:hypothetical protein